MFVRHRQPLVVAAAILVCGWAGHSVAAEPAAATAIPPAPRELVVVVSESPGNAPSSFGSYDRIARIFTEVFERRGWPATIRVERFGAEKTSHPTELRVFFDAIREETFGDLTFRARMVLVDGGRETDFGVVRFRYFPRPWQHTDDRLDNTVRGAAVVTAGRIEAALFPLKLPGQQ